MRPLKVDSPKLVACYFFFDAFFFLEPPFFLAAMLLTTFHAVRDLPVAHVGITCRIRSDKFLSIGGGELGRS